MHGCGSGKDSFSDDYTSGPRIVSINARRSTQTVHFFSSFSRTQRRRSIRSTVRYTELAPGRLKNISRQARVSCRQGSVNIHAVHVPQRCGAA
jgi:hypothetical protein